MSGEGYRLAEKGLEGTVGGAGIVSHGGLALLRALADKTVCACAVAPAGKGAFLSPASACHLRGH